VMTTGMRFVSAGFVVFVSVIESVPSAHQAPWTIVVRAGVGGEPPSTPTSDADACLEAEASGLQTPCGGRQCGQRFRT
jgi:hypothetical protein